MKPLDDATSLDQPTPQRDRGSSDDTQRRRRPSASDYAIIAVAPILVFLMISSLANFLMLVIYRGGQPARVTWVMLMFTMGVVGIARIAIEKDRMYSLGYAGLLGIATFVTVSSLVSSPIGTLLLLALIAYVSDWVIRDCTLIDDNVDSSDRGLLDSLWRGKGQPGRSVLILAAAAFPLYGLGQLFLPGNDAAWSRAHGLLASYLFSALALLVTTSFLGLRRYLRQRGAEMPANVTIAWLGGGAVLVASILLIAFLIPVPGQSMASLELPEFMTSTSDTAASKMGWGSDGADQADKGAASTSEDANDASRQKEEGPEAFQKGAAAGDVGDGDRKDGPAGKKDGGNKKTSGKQDGSSQQKGDQKPSPAEEAGKSGDEKQEQQSNQDDSQAADPKSDQAVKNDSGKEPQQPESEQAESEQPESEKPESQKSDAEKSDAEKSDRSSEQDPQQAKQSPAEQNRSSKANQRSNQAIQAVTNSIRGIAALIKWIVLLVLVGIVAFFLFTNREYLRQLWDQLFKPKPVSGEDGESIAEMVENIQSATRRSFASFSRPSPDQNDPKNVVVTTFAALDAWCHESGVSRGKGETPTEFLGRVQSEHRQLSKPAARVVASYNRIVYGRGNASRDDLAACEALWDGMINR